jgi:hypothetical protein
VSKEHAGSRKREAAHSPARGAAIDRGPPKRLEESIGNQAMQHMFLQDEDSSITLGESGDPYEQEAERVAQDVMSGGAATTKPAIHELSSKTLVQRACLPCHGEMLQPRRHGVGPSGRVPFRVGRAIGALRSQGGRPLPASTQHFMEGRFHREFGGVRIHTNHQATKAARSLNAEAFTLGSHIVFGPGHFEPDSTRGMRLLAHELTHVAQQGHAPRMNHGAAHAPKIARATPRVARQGPQPFKHFSFYALAMAGNRSFYWAITGRSFEISKARKEVLLRNWPVERSKWPFTDALRAKWNDARPSLLDEGDDEAATKRMLPFIEAVRKIQHDAGLQTTGVLDQAAALAVTGKMKGGLISERDEAAYHMNRQNFWLTHPDKIPKGSAFKGAKPQGLLAPPDTQAKWPYFKEWIDLWNALAPWPNANQVKPDALRAFIDSVEEWQRNVRAGRPKKKKPPGMRMRVVGAYEAQSAKHHNTHRIAAAKKHAEERAKALAERAKARAADKLLSRIDSIKPPVTGKAIADAFTNDELKHPGNFLRLVGIVANEQGDKAMIDFMSASEARLPLLAQAKLMPIAAQHLQIPEMTESRRVGLFSPLHRATGTKGTVGKVANEIHAMMVLVNKHVVEPIVSRGAEFFNGLALGLGSEWTEEKKTLLINNIAKSTAVMIAAPVVLHAGMVAGIAKEIWETIKFVVGAALSPVEFARQLKGLVTALWNQPRIFGFLIGQDLGTQIDAKLIHAGAIEFTYNVGELIGPVVASIILSFASGGAALAAKAGTTVAKFLKKLKGSRHLMNFIEGVGDLNKRFPALAKAARKVEEGVSEVGQALAKAKGFARSKLAMPDSLRKRIPDEALLRLHEFFKKKGDDAAELWQRIRPKRQRDALDCHNPCPIRDLKKIDRALEVQKVVEAEAKFIRKSNREYTEAGKLDDAARKAEFNRLGPLHGELAEGLLSKVVQLFGDAVEDVRPKKIGPSKSLKHPFKGSSIADRILKKGRKTVQFEVKRQLPAGKGEGLDRIVKQITNMVLHEKGKAVVWTPKAQSRAALNRILKALEDIHGPKKGKAIFDKVEFIEGVENLIDWMRRYFNI